MKVPPGKSIELVKSGFHFQNCSRISGVQRANEIIWHQSEYGEIYPLLSI